MTLYFQSPIKVEARPSPHPHCSTLSLVSPHPSPLMHPRSTSLACVHLGLFFVPQADGQHNCLTSLEKHMGTASSSAAIMNGVIIEPFSALALPRTAMTVVGAGLEVACQKRNSSRCKGVSYCVRHVTSGGADQHTRQKIL